MKKAMTFFFATAMVLGLVACSNNSAKEETQSSTNNQTTLTSEENESPETVTVISLNGAGEPVEVTVPYNPQRVAVVDMAALDILDNLNLGDRVVGSSSTSLDYLQSYVTDDSIAKLGTVKEADMEAIMECEPEVIFMGGRMAESYDALSEIAPVIRLTTDSELGVLESTHKNAKIIASIFGKESEVDEKFSDFDGRISALSEVAEGKTAVVGMCTSGSFNVIGNGGRCSIIGVEVGFENLCNDTSSGEGGGSNDSAHGSESSFELIASLAPDYIFVMDRDAAIGTNGAQLAKDIMENELVMSTDAYKNGNLIILEHPAVWYTAEGGITALSIMLSDLESALLN